MRRCDWAEHSPLEQEYHDSKWGIPVFDDHELFKMLMLERPQLMYKDKIYLYTGSALKM